jgi:hypothetical protein
MKKMELSPVWLLLFVSLCGCLHCGPRDLTDDKGIANNNAPQIECLDGETQACSTGLEGVCAAGIQTCQDSFFSACVQQNQPSIEICDGLDNDCNGQLDGICQQVIYSVPEYDGYFHHNYYRGPSPHGWPAYYCHDQIQTDGHGYMSGLTGGPQDDDFFLYWWPFITFDLVEFVGDWKKVTDLELNLQLTAFFPGPSPPTYPNEIPIRIWELNNDYSLVQNCNIHGNCRFDGTIYTPDGNEWNGPIWNATYDPPGCGIPEINRSAIITSLLPLYQGLYSLPGKADEIILLDLLKQNQGEKISFWLDLGQWQYIRDETTNTPPELVIYYYE